MLRRFSFKGQLRTSIFSFFRTSFRHSTANCQYRCNGSFNSRNFRTGSCTIFSHIVSMSLTQEATQFTSTKNPLADVLQAERTAYWCRCIGRASPRYNSLSAYGQSKLANVLHANELARRLKEENVEITANSLHPGAKATNLLRHFGFLYGLVAVLVKHVMKNVQQGAAKTCYVALHPDVKGMSGKYYSYCALAETSLQAKRS